MQLAMRAIDRGAAPTEDGIAAYDVCRMQDAETAQFTRRDSNHSPSYPVGNRGNVVVIIRSRHASFRSFVHLEPP
jgi:hypothetical protein